MNIVSSLQTKNIVKNQLDESNKILLTQLQQILDSRLSEAKKLSSQISWNRNMGPLRFTPKDMRDYSWYSVEQLSKDFLSYTASNEFIDEFYVFFRNSDLILKHDSTSYRGHIYETFHADEHFTYERWKVLLGQPYIEQFMSIPFRSSSTLKMGNAIAYIKALPTEVYGEAFATVVILMNQEKFIQAAKEIQRSSDETILILDNYNNIVASTGSLQILGNINYESMVSNDSAIGSIYQKLEGKSVVISFISSNVAKWKYVKVIPKQIYLEREIFVKNIALISILVVLTLGGIIAYIFSFRNYNPIKELIGIISNNHNLSEKEPYNEYHYIKQAFSNMFDEQVKTKRRLDQQNDVVRLDFLGRLIKGKFERGMPIEEKLEHLGIQFESDYFAVMVFFIDDISNIFDESSEDSIADIKAAQFIIKNVFEEIIGQKHPGTVIEVNEMLTCLVNIRESIREEAIQQMYDAAYEAQQFICKNFNIYFTASISTIHQSVEEISHAYDEAMEAMEYRMIEGAGSIIRHSQVIIQKSNYYNYYSLETERHFINTIKIGDYEKSKEIIEDIIVNNILKPNVAIPIAKCLMFNLVSTMIKAIDEINSSSQEGIVEELDPVNRLLKCETIIEMQNEIIRILKVVCEQIEVQKKSHNVDLKDKIIGYIQKNYYDINMCVATIADEFNMNAAYMSRFFKEQQGETLLDYIHKVRITESKCLLEDQNLNIGTIAEKVGYNNSNVFILAFKKYEGVTPGKYRKMV